MRFELTKPSECKSDALPTELQPLIKRLPRFELGLYLRQRYLLPLQHNRIKYSTQTINQQIPSSGILVDNRWDLNPRHSRCKRDVLPTELLAHFVVFGLPKGTTTPFAIKKKTSQFSARFHSIFIIELILAMQYPLRPYL